MALLDLTFLLPILLLVVTGLAGVAREVDILSLSRNVHDDVNLLHFWHWDERLFRPISLGLLSPGEKVADRMSWGSRDADHSEGGGGVEPPDEDSVPSPSLGRFNHIHGFNSFLVAVALVLTALTYADVEGVLLALIIAVFWISLPTIEVEEYDTMLTHFTADDSLNSLSFHTFASGIVSLPAVALAYADVSGYPVEAQGAGAVVFIFAGVIVGNVYQSMLDDELHILTERLAMEADGQEGPSE